MRSYRVSHHASHQLRRGLFVFSKRANRDTAMMLAYLGEFDERKLYRPEAYSSMHQFCVGALGMSEDSADKRIRVARITREHPGLFPAIADGRLHLSGVLLLAPVLTSANAENLVHAASRKSCAQIREMLATWFPKEEPVAQVVMSTSNEATTGLVAEAPAEPASKRVWELSGTADSLAFSVNTPPRPASFARFTPVAPGRYAIEGRVDQALVDKLRRSQELMSHGGKSCELAELLEFAADLLLAHAERKRFGATDKPRKSSGSEDDGDRITNQVKREVYTRDGGQCTFTCESGRRCEARDNIEFDHIQPIARGGRSDASNVQLLCRAHNQLRAEQTYGAGFMAEKREASRQRAIERAERARAKAAQQRANDAAEELVPGLEFLGYSTTEARARARNANLDPDQPLEERMSILVKTLGPRGVTRTPAPEPAAR
jgi:5-methylcytosine-specific restriction endonuclease McrA